MANFSVSDTGQNRFEGDFQVAVDAHYTPTAEERAYLDKLAATLTNLAAEVKQDTEKFGLRALLAVQREQRESAAAQFREIAEQFVNGRTGADISIAATDEVAKDFAAHYPKIVIQDTPPDQARFTGDFTCECFQLPEAVKRLKAAEQQTVAAQTAAQQQRAAERLKTAEQLAAAESYCRRSVRFLLTFPRMKRKTGRLSSQKRDSPRAANAVRTLPRPCERKLMNF